MAGTSQNKTYDPKKVVIIVGGVPLSGYGDTFVVVARASDAYESVVGADGEVTRTRIQDKRGTITVTLKQTSKSNDILAAFAAADELDNDGVVPVAVKDLLGTSLHFSAEAWVKKVPDSEYAKAAGEKEWVLECGILETFPGGN